MVVEENADTTNKLDIASFCIVSGGVFLYIPEWEDAQFVPWTAANHLLITLLRRNNDDDCFSSLDPPAEGELAELILEKARYHYQRYTLDPPRVTFKRSAKGWIDIYVDGISIGEIEHRSDSIGANEWHVIINQEDRCYSFQTKRDAKRFVRHFVLCLHEEGRLQQYLW